METNNYEEDHNEQTNEEIIVEEEEEYSESDSFSKFCNVSTVEVNGKKSICIANASGTITVRTEDERYCILMPSIENGLRINDSFKLSNNHGQLCYIETEDDIDVNDIIGKFMEVTGRFIKIIDNISDESEALMVPEVTFSTSANSKVIGIATADHRCSREFTSGNRIHNIEKYTTIGKISSNSSQNGEEDIPRSSSAGSDELNDNEYNKNRIFISVSIKGFHIINCDVKDVDIGDLLVPTANGDCVKCNDEIVLARCGMYRIPIGKVISKSGSDVYVQIC